ncbi:hypothetical protein M3172_14515 [Mesobacillus subterraneus]|uniref:hypothetical protein n=1 Tax=Mesobacillus subterraneus TaxID=285983 RepID=UPI002040DEB9|nr:hypothetical protein [Mesobacillus subterraneus]MCM3574406.1 hypothetical protein [Mesobacillus subterraneus]
MNSLLSKIKRIVPSKFKLTIKKTPSQIITVILRLFSQKKFQVVSSAYLYEAKKIYTILNINDNLEGKLCFKNFWGYCVMPLDFIIGMDIKRVELSQENRNKNLLVNKDLLASEMIKYAHALDKGLHMPNKRETFGIEKSVTLESLLIQWVILFELSHPIYTWSKNLLFQYWNDQNKNKKIEEFLIKEKENGKDIGIN